jgi:cobalt-zinc-cadmium efflux system protein
VLIGLWVLPRTWKLLREAGQVLMQGVPAGLDLTQIREALLTNPDVAAVHDLHVWALGSKEAVLTAHIVLRDGEADPDRVRGTLAELLDHQFGIEHATLQVERAACEHSHLHA